VKRPSAPGKASAGGSLASGTGRKLLPRGTHEQGPPMRPSERGFPRLLSHQPVPAVPSRTFSVQAVQLDGWCIHICFRPSTPPPNGNNTHHIRPDTTLHSETAQPTTDRFWSVSIRPSPSFIDELVVQPESVVHQQTLPQPYLGVDLCRSITRWRACLDLFDPLWAEGISCFP
jgi:hypothetical protein